VQAFSSYDSQLNGGLNFANKPPASGSGGGGGGAGGGSGNPAFSYTTPPPPTPATCGSGNNNISSKSFRLDGTYHVTLKLKPDMDADVTNSVTFYTRIMQEPGNAGWVANVIDREGYSYYGIYSDGVSDTIRLSWTSWTEVSEHKYFVSVHLPQGYVLDDGNAHELFVSFSAGVLEVWVDDMEGVIATVQDAAPLWGVHNTRAYLMLGSRDFYSDNRFRGQLNNSRVSFDFDGIYNIRMQMMMKRKGTQQGGTCSPTPSPSPSATPPRFGSVQLDIIQAQEAIDVVDVESEEEAMAVQVEFNPENVAKFFIYEDMQEGETQPRTRGHSLPIAVALATVTVAAIFAILFVVKRNLNRYNYMQF